MRAFHLVPMLSAACTFSTGAFAQCAPLKMLNEIQMTRASGGTDLVPIAINGKPQSLVFSVSGTTSQITRDVATDLALPIKAGSETLYDELGTPYRDQVSIDEIKFGDLRGTKVTLPVAPTRPGRGGGSSRSSDNAGVFSLNYLLPYDIDVDFGNDKLRFFSQDHCPGAVLYWKASVSAAAPITVADGRVYVPLTLDGKEIDGYIDTASATSSVSAVVAERVLGLTTGDAATPASTETSGFGGKSFTHVFARFAIGGIAIKNISVRIPDESGLGGGGIAAAKFRSQLIASNMVHPRVTIGMDVLRKLHVYLAFGEKKVYLTPASAAPTAEAATTPPAAPK